MKTTYSRIPGQKNNAGAVLTSLTVAACTALVLFSRCGPKVEPRMDADQPRNGDHVCEQSEAYPWKIGPDRLFTRERNPNYSKLDCHDGDGVLDDSPDVRGMDGNTLPPVDARGQPVQLPLEGPDSLDFRWKIVHDQPCIPGNPGLGTPKLNRPLVSAKPGEMIIRPREEWEQMVRDPSSMPKSIFDPATGNNSFKRPWLLAETCDSKLPDCTPSTNEPCFAANHPSCPPRRKASEPARKHGKPAATVILHETAADCKTTDPARAQEAVGPIRNNILDARGEIDKKYPQFAGMEIKVNYRGRIDANGDVSLPSASVQGKDIRGLVDMGSVKVTTGKGDCEFIHTTAIPGSK